MAPLVEVSGLRVVAGAAQRPIVDDVSFAIAPGEVLALIGESGSGKTTTALAVMGYARAGCRIAGGMVRLGGTDVLAMTGRALADLRGRRVAYVAQSAAGAFNPAQRIMAQLVEAARIHGTMSVEAAEAKARGLFASFALPEADIGERYPHQVSGGQLQRAMAAMALINDPELVIFDEPTTALDVTTQIEVLRVFKRAVRERGLTGIYVSHDLAVVAQMADRILVLRDGRMQETGATARIVGHPGHPYTISLIEAAEPRDRRGGEEGDTAIVLSGAALATGYGGPGPGFVPTLEDVNFAIRRGTVLGVIGESGSGKSTLARVIAGLKAATAGTVTLNGERLPAGAERTRDQRRRLQLVVQSADTALNPAHTVREIVGRPLAFFHDLEGEARERRTRELADMVRLGDTLLDRHPSELSGGQRQRVSLARALAAEPDVLLCDEVTSALDTVVAAAVLDLLVELKRALGLSFMFISHDLGTISAICDDVMVLYAGRQADVSRSAPLSQRPMHPYTEVLLRSVPRLRPGWLESAGSIPAPERRMAGAAGCAFVGRCGYALEDTCATIAPPVRTISETRTIACHRSAEELAARQAPGSA